VGRETTGIRGASRAISRVVDEEREGTDGGAQEGVDHRVQPSPDEADDIPIASKEMGRIREKNCT